MGFHIMVFSFKRLICIHVLLLYFAAEIILAKPNNGYDR
uniref:Uncharacterized protein n=1 Tax=Arundo donax TaxID=35708 RepID=A0A0A9ENX1_ARUDO